MRHALVSMARLARAAGATEVVAVGTPPAWYRPKLAGGADRTPAPSSAFEDALAAFDFAPNRGGVFSAHQMGSVRMGADPRTTRATRGAASARRRPRRCVVAGALRW